jgi:catechol 2,3-dioxygenase-like lactoylglutathione lyase family enzyme
VTRAAEITGLHHVQLAMPPGREAEAERFYWGLLGIPRIPKPPQLEKRGGCWFRNAGVELHIGVEEPFVPAHKAHPALLVQGLDRLIARLQHDGAEIQWDEQLDGHRRCYVNDPFGNRLELIERTPTAEAPPRG